MDIVLAFSIALNIFFVGLYIYFERVKYKRDIDNFRLLFEINPLPVVITDLESGTFIKANGPAKRFFNIVNTNKTELSNYCTKDFYEDAKARKDIFDSIRDKKYIVNYPLRVKSMGGETDKWAVLTAMRFYYHSKEVILSIFTDITELKHKDVELQHKNTELEAIFNNTQMSIIFLINGRFFSKVNQKFLDTFEYSESEIIGNSVELIHLDSYHFGNFFKNYYDKLINGDCVEIDYQLKTKSAKVLWVRIFGKALDSNNLNGGVVWIMYDITDEKMSHQVIEETKNSLEEAQKIAHFGSFESTLDGNQIKISEEMRRIYNLEEKSFYSLSEFLEKVHKDDKRYVLDLLKKIETDGCESCNFEFKIVINGEIKYIQAKGRLVESEEKVRVVGTNQDITDIKLTQEALKYAKEEAEKANLIKSQFFTNLTHEIKTPMNAIIGFSELLSKGELSQIQKNYVESIQISSKNLLNLINDILDFSKLDTGKLTLNLHSVDIRNLIFDLKTIFDYKCGQKGIKFDINIDDSIPKYLLLDESRLRQILINIIGNGVKFTESGFINVVALFDETNLVIKVADSGIGILDSDKVSIFDVFVQKENKNSRKYEGTGLGLAITKKLLSIMNGEIYVESKIGEGSVFTIVLKDIKEVKKRDDEVKENNSKSKDYIKFLNQKVLVVDDIDFNREIFVDTLKMFNIQTLEAVDGADAIAKAREFLPELILMDIRMPVMDGYEATEKIKEFLDVPIIALTASVIDIKNSLLKFDGYISKPSKLDDILNELKKYLKYQKDDIKILEKVEITAQDIEKIQPLIQKLRLLRESSEFDDYINVSAEIESLIKDNKSLQELFNKLLIDINTFDLLEIDRDIVEILKLEK